MPQYIRPIGRRVTLCGNTSTPNLDRPCQRYLPQPTVRDPIPCLARRDSPLTPLRVYVAMVAVLGGVALGGTQLDSLA